MFQLQEVRKTIQKMETETKKYETNEKQSQKIAQEVEVLKGKLKAAKEEAKKPPPIVEKLQKEIAEIKVYFFEILLSLSASRRLHPIYRQ